MVTITDHHPDQPRRPDPPRNPNPWPILQPGTLVKAQIRGYRFQWLPVIEDPGPANDRERRVTIQARAQKFHVRRHNVIQKQGDVSKFDTVHDDLVPGEDKP